LDPDRGKVIVAAHGRRHEITCGADPISQRPVITDDVTDLAKSKNPQAGAGEIKQAFQGTSVRLEWGPRTDDDGQVVWPFGGLLPLARPPSSTSQVAFADTFRLLVEGFALFNPHATITLDWFGKTTTWEATLPTWQKWKPHRPTSPHWYEQRHLERLLG